MVWAVRVGMPLHAALLGVAAVALAVGVGLRGRGGPPSPTRAILVTGFGPFGSYLTNPSWEAIRDLDGTVVGGCVVRTARIDVAYRTAAGQLEAALAAHRPDAVLCLGVAPGTEIRVETVARNRDSSPAPDQEGVVRDGRPIREGAADLPTRLPVEGLVAALAAEGYAVRRSEDAGGYLCNHLFFHLMDGLPVDRPAGFVHVPALEGGWTLERLRAAARRMVEVLGAALR